MLSGTGKVTVGTETASIKADDAIPLSFAQTKSFESTGNAALELLEVGVVKDASRRMQIAGTTPYGGGNAGRANAATPAAAAPARGAAAGR